MRDAGASLSVDAVGQNHLRVSGSTATGAAGRLGTVTYTISDGTDDRGARVEGEATVFLLPPAPELAPDRRRRHRGRPRRSPDRHPGARQRHRPCGRTAHVEPGIRRVVVQGRARLRGRRRPAVPRAQRAGRVHGRVLGVHHGRSGPGGHRSGAHRGPGGRGQPRAAPRDARGPGAERPVDPRRIRRVRDGSRRRCRDARPDRESAPDRVGDGRGRRRVDRVHQRARRARPGVVPLPRGRRVRRNGRGGGAHRRARQQSNPSPITFTDYVQVQAGPASSIRVSPLANDVDPTMGTLRVTDVRPDVPSSLSDGSENPEYDRLRAGWTRSARPRS